MNRTILNILIIFLFASCKSKPNQPITSKAPIAGSTQIRINQLKPILQGVWVKQDFIDKVIAAKSPLAGTDKVIGITTIQISTDNITADSLPVKVSYDNKQAGGVILKFKPGKHAPAMPFGENELSYYVKDGDTSLILHQHYDNQWVLTPYVRALKRWGSRDLQEGITYLINKNIFAGNYSCADSLGKTSTVVFKVTGEVSGLADFSKYFVENTFDSKVMNNLDQLIFDQFSPSEKTYTFKFIGNILNLYEIKPNTSSTLLIQGKLKYRLVKISD